jgi:hypothetical protein
MDIGTTLGASSNFYQLFGRFNMRNGFVCIAIAVAILICARGAHAQTTLAYTFEVIAPGGGPPGPDGFFGLGAAVTQEPTLGVTHLENSMKYDVAAAPGFVGARTEIVPAALNNPPGVSHVLFDLYKPAAYAGTFADIGVTVFGHDIDNANFGIQSQFTDTVSLAALAVGQHFDLRIDLDSEFFSGESFNEIFGDDTSDLDVASAFQFYISKNGGTQGSPITVYIDNVRLVVPEPATFAILGLGAVVIGGIWRRRIR